MIIKYPSIAHEIEMAQLRQCQRGSRRNLISKSCINCGLLFETFKVYQKETCRLCRYEKAVEHGDGEKFMEAMHKIESVEHLYSQALAKGVTILNKKIRTAKAYKCTIHNLNISKRLNEFMDFIETDNLTPQNHER